MTEQTVIAGRAVVPPLRSWGIMTFLFCLGAVVYILVAVVGAIYLLYQAYHLPANAPLNDFNKLAIGALIAVVGTGLSASAAIYSASRQSATNFQVARYNGELAANLAAAKQSADTDLVKMKGDIDKSLAQLKTSSDESLTRLKAALDASQNANRELFGTASVYFYALRSVARGTWDEESLKASEGLMITAMRHLVNVNEDLRNQWFDFWQRAQDIHHQAAKLVKVKERPALVAKLIGDAVETEAGELNLRDLHHRLEETAKLAPEPPPAGSQQANGSAAAPPVAS